MKRLILSIFIVMLAVNISEAQLRQDLYPHTDEYSATLTHQTSNNSLVGNWMNMLNMTMNHSYSLNFSTFGRQMQNLNAYTNHMRFDIADRLGAQVDISRLHAPCGNSYLPSNNDFGASIIVDQGRINYQLSPNTQIAVQFSQRPGYYGQSPFGMSGFRPRSEERRVGKECTAACGTCHEERRSTPD